MALLNNSYRVRVEMAAWTDDELDDGLQDRRLPAPAKKNPGKEERQARVPERAAWECLLDACGGGRCGKTMWGVVKRERETQARCPLIMFFRPPVQGHQRLGTARSQTQSGLWEMGKTQNKDVLHRTGYVPVYGGCHWTCCLCKWRPLFSSATTPAQTNSKRARTNE